MASLNIYDLSVWVKPSGFVQVYIKAIGETSAEMVTDQGAIYVTSNRGYNWKAAVQESVSATLNRYVPVYNEF